MKKVVFILMPKGNAELTDQILHKRIQKFNRPIAIKDLVNRLKWSRGKTDGAVGRLAKKKSIAIVNLSIPGGQRQRYVGIPGKEYWQSFYNYFFKENNSILIYDTLEVLNNYQGKKDIPNSKTKQTGSKGEITSMNIDISILETLENKLHLLKPVAESRNTTTAQLLIDRLEYVFHPYYDILFETGLIIANQADSDDEKERADALGYLKRAQDQISDRD